MSEPTPFWSLDARVKWLFLGFAFSALGSGLTMPFLYVYLTHIRDFPTTTVGAVFAWMGVVGFLATGPTGTLIDRYGPRLIMVVGLSIEAVAVAAIGHVSQLWQAFGLATLVVLGTAGVWPASTAMLTRMVEEKDRERLYGFNFMILNLGLGIGGLIAATIIDADSLASFQRLYYLDALSYVGYLVVLVLLPAGTGQISQKDLDAAEGLEEPSWSVVLRDKRLVSFTALAVLTLTFSYAQMETGFAAYSVDVAGVPPESLGIAFGANTAVIVLGQLLVMRLIATWSRSTALIAACLIWSVSWVMIASAGWVSGTASIVAITVGLGTFGLAETFWAPSAPAVVNALAREDMRGRYNSLLGMTWTVGTIAGPGIAGVLLGNDLATVWVILVIGGTALSALGFFLLRKQWDEVAEPEGDTPETAESVTH